MKGIIKILKSKKLLIVIGFFLVIYLILVAGSRFGLSLNTQLLCIIAVLFISILFLLVKQMKANRGANLLEQSIKAQADEQKLAFRPDKREEIEELKNELSSAIESLKKSKLSKGRRGRAALYALPWYIFIGPPAAGKTTAIINSGLEFPFGSDIKGVGGTRNCDWFFSNSAILLDTAGRYITEDEDKEEWLAFLDILKKYRSRKPINGVIVGISIIDIIQANFEEIEWHAKNIRHRINELIQRLGIRFPVYLVFTKCDLIQGFVELFENLSRKEREQVWGCTLSREQQNASNPSESFDEEFQILVQSLNDIRLKRLSSPTKPENRSKVFVFPLEFASIKENVGYFIDRLFQPSPYQERPFFRGFYFTSGTQEGVPVDRVIQAIAKQFGLPPEQTSEPEMEKKSYFIKRLFARVIIPDQNMVAQTTKAATSRNLVRIGAVAASIIGLGAFVLGISQAYVRSKINLNAVKEAAELMKEVRWEKDASLVSTFRQLERFREQLAELEDNKANPPGIPSGMYRGNMVLQPAHKLYDRKARPFVKAYLYQVLENRLRAYRYGEPYDSLQIYNYLKAYLLMGSETGRLDTTNVNFLSQELISILEDGRYFPSIQEDVGELIPLIKGQIEFFVKSLGKEDKQAFENDENLIRYIQNSILIGEQPNIDGIYTRLKLKEEARALPPFTLSHGIGEGYEDIIFGDYEIPGFFTKYGWDNYVKEAIDSESKNPAKADWVLGVKQEQLPENMRDPQTAIEVLHRRYFQEYAEAWWNFLRNIQYKSFDNLESASGNLKKLSNFADSPLTILIDYVTEQTKFERAIISKGMLEKAVDIAKKGVRKIRGAKKVPTSQEQRSAHPIDQEFLTLHGLSTKATKGEGAPNILQNILSQYATISEILESMLNEPGAGAKDYAARIIQQGSGEFPDALRTIRRSLNENEFDLNIRQALFEQPIKNAWVVILNEVQSHLNSLWLDKVFEPFQKNLANYYPFNPQGRDAPIVDVESFFEPQKGTLWTFIESELKPFVKLEYWSPNTWEEKGIRLSSEAVNALRQADKIKNSLFSRGRFEVNFRLLPDQPITVSGSHPVIEQIYLVIDGEEDYYRMGHRQWKAFSWPGEGTSGASLKLLMRDGDVESKQYDGEWGWFKLLEKAEIQKETSSVFKLFWYFGRGDRYQVIVKYDLRASSADNPFHDAKDLFNFHCPSRLINLSESSDLE